MKRIDIMRRAGRNLQQAKGRTFLTSLAIAVGAFTLTLSLAAGQGAREYADNLLKNNIDPQALFIVKDKAITSAGAGDGIREYTDDLSSTTAGSGASVAVKMLTKDDITKLQARTDIKEVVPIYSLSSRYVAFQGIDKKYAVSLNYYDSSILSDVAAGSLPKLGEQIGSNEILVPEDYLETLGVTAEQLVGKTVVVTVPQVTATPTQEDITNAFVSGGDKAVQELFAPKTKNFSFTVRAVLKKSAMAITSNPQLHVSTTAAGEMFDYASKGTENADKYLGATAIAKHDPAVTKTTLEKDYGYSVQTAKDAQGLLFTFVNILQGIVAGFATLALIASVFGIINTQYISVLERTSQIGLMKALGMRRRDIGKLFRYEAAWIGFLGGALGVGLALILGWLMNPWITKQLDLGGQTLLIFVWWQVAILILSLVVIAIIAGWLPARKAARLDPIEALRTE
jgi:putative ABC transport system permease protein